MKTTNNSNQYRYEEETIRTLVTSIEQELQNDYNKLFSGRKEHELLDQVFCTLLDLENDHMDYILHGMFYVFSLGLSFSGIRINYNKELVSPLRKMNWFKTWNQIYQIRVLLPRYSNNDEELLMYVITYKDEYDGIKTRNSRIDMVTDYCSYVFTIKGTAPLSTTKTMENSIVDNCVERVDPSFKNLGIADDSSNILLNALCSSNSFDLLDINLRSIRNMRWRSFLYILSRKWEQHKENKTEETLANFDEDIRRIFIYNSKFFKSIQLVTVDHLEFNPYEGRLELMSDNERSDTISNSQPQIVTPRRENDSIMEERMNMEEEEQEDHINKKKSPSIIIKDYFDVTENIDLTYTETTNDENTYTDTDVAEDSQKLSSLSQMQLAASGIMNFSIKSMFHKTSNASILLAPPNPEKNILLEYRNLLLNRSFLMNMTVKMVPAVLRVEEDKFTKQITISVYNANSKTVKLLDPNMYDIRSIKKIEVLTEGANSGMLSIVLATGEGDNTNTWLFNEMDMKVISGSSSNISENKSLNTIANEIYSIFYKYARVR
jgi:hypothetical protein